MWCSPKQLQENHVFCQESHFVVVNDLNHPQTFLSLFAQTKWAVDSIIPEGRKYMERMSYENEIRRMRITLIFDNFPQTLTFCEIFTSKFHSVYRGLSKIMGNCQRFGTHFRKSLKIACPIVKNWVRLVLVLATHSLRLILHIPEIKSLMKLNPKSDEAKMKDVVDKLSYEEELVCDEIQHLVKKKTRDLDLEVQNYLWIILRYILGGVIFSF